MPDRLMRFMVEGMVQIALLYTPQLRPGLTAQRVMDEELVLAASWPADLDEIPPHYAFVDWGPEFVHAHALELPELTNPGRTLALGAMAADYVAQRHAAAYLPARYIKRYLDAGTLHLVPDAPRFPYPVWSVWRDDLDPEIRDAAVASLTEIRAQITADQTAVLADLAEISEGHVAEVMGHGTDLT
jgi:DNA-binding transcriptional LysR family regulator